MRLGVWAKLSFAVFCKTDSGPCHERPQGGCAGHAAVDKERVEPKHRVLHHVGDNLVWKFLVREQVPCTGDPLLYDFNLFFIFWACSSAAVVLSVRPSSLKASHNT